MKNFTRRGFSALSMMAFAVAGMTGLATTSAVAAEQSYFSEQCKNPSSDAIAHTIKQILVAVGAEDCEKARTTLNRSMDLDLSGKGIVDMSPLKEFNNFLVLNISKNNIKDFSFLSGKRKLKRFFASSNDIDDATLANIVQIAPQIAVIYLDNNKLTDISPLRKLADLRTLSATNNQITSFDFRGQRKINVLNLSHNKITSVEGIGDQMRLLEVELRGNQITDISALAPHTSIWYLDVNDNKITSLETAGRLYNLMWLKAEGNQISDLGPIAAHNKLEGMYLSRNKIAELPAFTNPVASILHLEGNQITDVAPIAALGTLFTLALDDNKINDIGALKDLEGIRTFSMKGNPLGSSTQKTGDNCPADAKSPVIAKWCGAAL